MLGAELPLVGHHQSVVGGHPHVAAVKSQRAGIYDVARQAPSGSEMQHGSIGTVYAEHSPFGDNVFHSSAVYRKIETVLLSYPLRQGHLAETAHGGVGAIYAGCGADIDGIPKSGEP